MKIVRDQEQTASMSPGLASVRSWLAEDKPLTAPQTWLLGSLLAILMLGPIWIGEYAPLFDYGSHLLEAQIVVYYTDPQLNYAESYQINPGWYWRSNALTTLLLIWLTWLMPVALAGHLVLSLYIFMFVGSLAWLLYRAGTAWPLLLAAPALGYNFAFTTGWINFCYALALAGFTLILYEQWRDQARWSTWLILAGVMLLIYMAHVVVWILILIVIVAMASLEIVQGRRQVWLWLALNSAWPMILLGWPGIAALAIPLIGPALWLGVTLVQRWRLDLRLVVGGAIVLSGVLMLPLKWLEDAQPAGLPRFEYYVFDKVTFPLRRLTLPHQYMPPNFSLVSYNLLLLGLLLVISWLLIRRNISSLLSDKPWLLAVGILTVIYLLSPSHINLIWTTEPRVLLVAGLVTLPRLRLPAAGTQSRRILVVSLGLLCLVSLIGTTRYAQVFDQQAAAWQAQMAHLQPAQRVLMLKEKTSPYLGRPTLLGVFNRFYTGEFFPPVYNIEQGGFASATFENGPVSLRLPSPIFYYDWPEFDHTRWVAENCAELRAIYEAVLFWGKPDAQVAEQLNECFTAGPQWADMGIWYIEKD
jgi:hypothetical protein